MKWNEAIHRSFPYALASGAGYGPSGLLFIWAVNNFFKIAGTENTFLIYLVGAQFALVFLIAMVTSIALLVKVVADTMQIQNQ